MRTKRDKPILLDLFCGAGGAAMGYHRAGFEVIGVDLEPQPYYPFEFYRYDAMWVLDHWLLSWFDAIHASPPCQLYSTMGNRARLPAPNHLPHVIEKLRAQNVPWIVENVIGARRLMPTAFQLTGGMFDLGVHRPRLFESNVVITTPPKCKPPLHGIGVYGRTHDGRRLSTRTTRPGQSTPARTYHAPSSLVEAHEAMGMDWADWHGTKEAIPPDYTEYIGHQLIAHLASTIAA